MSGQPARGYLGISEVLAELRADFPDISVSKIRFLETEGLISPARSPSGYRRFCTADLDRLRFILTAQRDEYLPLRVIKDRLARLDQDQQPAPGRAPAPAPASGREPARRGHEAQAGSSAGAGAGAGASAEPQPQPLLSRRELVETAGLSEALLTELETFGLLRRVGRQYGSDALEVARTAVALTSFGVEARHLRAVRAAAERETAMVESLVAPILRQRGAGARELAGRTARDCAELVLRLHAALVDGALAEAGLAEGGLAERSQAAAGLAEPRRRPHTVEGATA
jgi:DNA-binding transcriptional MerR regulator